MVASVLKLIQFHKNQFFIQNVNFPVFNLEWNLWTSLPNEKSSWNYVIIDCPGKVLWEGHKNFAKITTLDLSYVVTVKSTVEILQNFVAFSEYIMNFNA